MCPRSVIEEAQNRRRQVGLDISVRVARLFELELERDESELIVCCEVLEHLDDPEDCPQRPVSTCPTVAASQRSPGADVAIPQPGAR